MDPEEFIFYADYFAWIAKSGLQGAQSLYDSISSIKAIDPSTCININDSVNSQSEMLLCLRTSYERIFTNMISTDPLEGPFMALSEYIKEKHNMTIDEYLTAYGLQVNQTYASISEIFGDTISQANIREGI